MKDLIKDFSSIMNPTRWAVLAGVALALMMAAGGALLYAHGAGKDAGRSEVQAKWSAADLERAQAEIRTALLRAERVATLSNELMEAQSAHAQAVKDLAIARAGAHTRGQRVRNTAASNELDQRIAAAECTVARAFAAGSFRAAASCRDHLAEIGLGPGGLVESAASAHYEHRRAEALRQFVMPRSPFKPVKE